MSKPITHLTRSLAQLVDQELMSMEYGFTLDQLMELAGLSVAMAIHRFYPTSGKVLVWCGPGNNGGDGLVAVFYPKPGKHQLFTCLQKQLCKLQIPIYTNEDALTRFNECVTERDLIVDALFGFSFSGQVRPPFDEIIHKINSLTNPVISVDIPSGWDVEKGILFEPYLDQILVRDSYVRSRINEISLNSPSMLVSLTAPKLGVKDFNGIHIAGGRFIPPVLAEKLGINLPHYSGSEQISLLHDPFTT